MTERRRHERAGGHAAVNAFGELERGRPGEALGLYCGNANPLLANRIARYLGTELGSSEVFEFANENIFVRILENVRAATDDVRRLLGDDGIVRHEGKIRSTINNAARALELIEERGSLASYFWSWAAEGEEPPDQLAPVTEASTALSRDLKRRGWSFVGPTTVYAFMEAMGLVNDHLAGCHVRDECAAERRRVLALAL